MVQALAWAKDTADKHAYLFLNKLINIDKLQSDPEKNHHNLHTVICHEWTSSPRLGLAFKVIIMTMSQGNNHDNKSGSPKYILYWPARYECYRV